MTFQSAITPKRYRKLTVAASALFLAIIFASARAHTEDADLEIIGDRPDFTESAVTVPPVHLQGEFGVAYSTMGEDKLLTVPNLLLRLGVNDNMELRLGAPSAKTSFWDLEPDTYPGGVETGIKLATPVGKEWAIGVLPYAVWPINENQWNGTGLELGIKGLWATDLTSILSLGGNLGVIFNGVAPESAEFMPEYLVSLSLGISILNWLGTFFEVYGIINNDADLALVLDSGFTFLVASRLQLDMHYGVGITDAAKGFDVGAGAIFLF